MKRIIVYIVVIGNYDSLPAIIKDEGIEYYCFTDNIPEDTNGWQCIYFNPAFVDGKMNSVYLKSNPHLFFPWNALVVFIDANIEVFIYSKQELLDLSQERSITVLPHRMRNYVFGETAIIANENLDNVNRVMAWEQELKSMEFPDTQKLSETPFLIRDLSDPKVRIFNETWWSLMLRGSRRDQLSFNPALWYLQLECNFINIDLNDSKRSGTFKFPFVQHQDASRRSVVNSFPSHEVSEYAPFCWLEMVSSKTISGDLKEHFICQQESWTGLMLQSIRALNSIVEEHNSQVDGRYFFIDKNNISEYSTFDIRLAWKREYLKKAVMPSKWGLEIGFMQGYSAALMLGSNPNLSIIAIESNSNNLSQACADKLISLYPRVLEVYFDRPAKVLKELTELLPLEKIEFIHYNVTEKNDLSEFWEFMEWYLCNASLGCRLIISDQTPEWSNISEVLFEMGSIAMKHPGIPDIAEVKQYIKLKNIDSTTYIDFVSLCKDKISTKDKARLLEVEVAELNGTQGGVLLMKNMELVRENEALKGEVKSLESPILVYENPVTYYKKRLKAFIKRRILLR